MILESLDLSLDQWGDNKGRYTGRAIFAGNKGKVQINLSPDTSDKVLKILASQLVEAAQETAKLMTAQIISTAANPQLENQE
jgi:hypothetical protein